MTAQPDVRTHQALDRSLCGEPVTVTPGHAEVALTPTAAMVADRHGLVHGGFVFGLADHAAMLAVNEPTVVLAKAESRFLAPVRAEERLVALARVKSGVDGAGTGRPDRPVVEVTIEAPGGIPVFTGTFHCAVPERHVLDPPARAPEASGEAETAGGER